MSKNTKSNFKGCAASVVVWLAYGISSHAATVHYDVAIDLSDPAIYDIDVGLGLFQIEVPLNNPDLLSYSEGDMLTVSIGFVGQQRLMLSTTQAGGGNLQAIGVYVADNTLDFGVSGSGFASVDLIDPLGQYLTDSAAGNSSFSNAQGSITGLVADWTDSSFSVAGFFFEMPTTVLSETILPNTITLDFRGLLPQAQIVPVPPAILLFASALGVMGLWRKKA